jgi:hypothetical protein
MQTFYLLYDCSISTVFCSFQLISHADTIILGLVLLQTASEELACPRDDLVASRKEDLYQLMLKQASTVLTLLNGRSIEKVHCC